MITLFSWGYWGWGNRTRELVDAIDAAERARGFNPPKFVDVRIRRSGRAVGFRERAFEHLVGPGRYSWFRGLGNARVLSGEPGIKIYRPEAAAELLALAVELGASRRRVIFFCSCKPEDATTCHRTNVARLVRKEAKKVGVRVRVAEWRWGRGRFVKADLDCRAALEHLPG